MAYSSKPKKIEQNIYLVQNENGSKRFIVHVKDRMLRWFPQKSFATKREARVYRHKLLCQKDSGALAPEPSKNHLTVAEYWPMWASERRLKVSAGWKMSQDQMARDHVLPYLGRFKLVEVRPRDIGNLFLVLDKKKLSNQTQRHIFNLLSVVFREAVEHFEFLDFTPVRKKYRPEVSKKIVEALTPDEAIKLAQHSRTHLLGPAVWLALFAGLRVEAIHALRWSSVNFKTKRILIIEAFKRKEGLVVPYPKGKDMEFVIMPDVLSDFLRDLRQRQKAKDKDLEVPSVNGAMLDYSVLYQGVRKLCKEEGVPVVSPHILRHSSTEIYVRYGGATMEDIRRLLHHKSVETTKRYMHRTDERSYDLAGKVSSKLSSLLNGPCGPDDGGGDSSALPQSDGHLEFPTLRLVKN